MVASTLQRAASALGAALTGAAEPDVIIDIAPWKLSLVVVLLIVPLAVSVYTRLGLHGALVLAAARCVLQVLLLGSVLRFLFAQDNVWWTGAYIAFMMAMSSFEAISRPSMAYKGMFRDIALGLLVPALLTIAYMLAAIVQPRQWFDPQYTIPLLGMLLGNALNGVTIGVKAFLEALSAERAAIEWALAMGAGRFEAIWPAVQRVLQTALTPTINMLSVAGLVSIPGMMTGQILAGGDAVTAAKYQIMIMFGIAAAGTCASIVAVGAAACTLTDESHRLRLDRLTDRGDELLYNLWVRCGTFVWGAVARVHALCCGRRGRGGGGDEGGESPAAEQETLLPQLGRGAIAV